MSYSNGLKRLIGENVEVYCGQSRRTVKYSDYDYNEKAVVRGELIEVSDDCIVVKVTKSNPIGGVHSNDMFINTWSITAVCVPQDKLSMIDMWKDEGKSLPK